MQMPFVFLHAMLVQLQLMDIINLHYHIIKKHIFISLFRELVNYLNIAIDANGIHSACGSVTNTCL